MVKKWWKVIAVCSKRLVVTSVFAATKKREKVGVKRTEQREWESILGLSESARARVCVVWGGEGK